VRVFTSSQRLNWFDQVAKGESNMNIKTITSSAIVALAAIAASNANAQLLVATADRDESLWGIDLNTIRPGNFPVPANIATATPFFNGFSIWGMTADDVAREYYFIEVATSELFKVSYDSPQSPVSMGIIRRPNDNQPFTPVGLAVDSSTGQFYCVNNVGGSAVTPKGILTIDTTNPPIVGGRPALYVEPALPFGGLPGGDSAFDVRNLDYDPVTDKLYFINDDNDGDGRGLYEANVAGQSVLKRVASPTYRRIETDFDGLATGGGKAYWVTDEPGFIYVYDLVNGGPFTDFLSPITTESGLLGGAAYAGGLIPEPSTFALALAAVGLVMRRSR
jgi:hypothetical protein